MPPHKPVPALNPYDGLAGAALPPTMRGVATSGLVAFGAAARKMFLRDFAHKERCCPSSDAAACSGGALADSVNPTLAEAKTIAARAAARARGYCGNIVFQRLR